MINKFQEWILVHITCWSSQKTQVCVRYSGKEETCAEWFLQRKYHTADVRKHSCYALRNVSCKKCLFQSLNAEIWPAHCNSYDIKWGAWIAQWYSSGLRAGWSGFESWQGLGNFLFTIASRPALGPTQPPTQWVLGAFSLEVKRPGR
jgi:hypothetical protein